MQEHNTNVKNHTNFCDTALFEGKKKKQNNKPPQNTTL